MDNAESIDRGQKLLAQMLGPEQAEKFQRAWHDLCPDFEKYVVGFVAGDIWSRPNLDLRTKSLTSIAALVAMGRWRAAELNMRMALNNGASKQDIVETLLQIAPYAGFPATWEALTIAHQVFQESA